MTVDQEEFSRMNGIVLFVIGLTALSGCGGSPNSGSCRGPLLTDEQLCKLKCGSTSVNEAKQILGAPTASTDGMLQYSYICLEERSGAGSGVTYFLFFNTVSVDGSALDRLHSVERVATGSFASGALPSCVSLCK
jgi:hypothetical protein